MIILGDRKERLKEEFASVETVGYVNNHYAMPYNHIGIFYCRGMKAKLADVWPKVKNWH